MRYTIGKKRLVSTNIIVIVLRLLLVVLAKIKIIL